jgi:hypothetical protein
VDLFQALELLVTTKFKLSSNRSQLIRCTKLHLTDLVKLTKILVKTKIDLHFSVLQINIILMVNKMRKSKDSLKSSKKFFINSKCSSKIMMDKKCSLSKMIKRMPSSQRLNANNFKPSRIFLLKPQELKMLRRWVIFSKLTVVEITLST